jgi:hypothetical protein
MYGDDEPFVAGEPMPDDLKVRRSGLKRRSGSARRAGSRRWLYGPVISMASSRRIARPSPTRARRALALLEMSTAMSRSSSSPISAQT